MNEENEKPLVEIKIQDVFGVEKASKNIAKALESSVGPIAQPVLARMKSYLEDRASYARALNQTKSISLVISESIKEIDFINSSNISDEQKDILSRAIMSNYESSSRHQLNREIIGAYAIESAPVIPSENTTEEEVDDDWLNLFWECAEKITKEDVQRVFANILVSESVHPGAISRKTLQILSVMDSTDCMSFQHACSVSLSDDSGVTYLMASTTDYEDIRLNQNLLNPQDEFHLASLGLVTSTQSQVFDKETDTHVFIGDDRYQINIVDEALFEENEEISYLFFVFSPAGEELKECISHKVVEEFARGIKDFFLGRLGIELVKC